MKRIYFTAIPLQDNKILEEVKMAPANFTLGPGAPDKAHFPITPIIAGTMLPGDEAVVVAVRHRNQAENPNIDVLRRELAGLGLPCRLEEVVAPDSRDRHVLMDMFIGMVGKLEANACYYACITFGTKVFPAMLFSAFSYAEKIKPGAEVRGIYYQDIRWKDRQIADAALYDVSALFTLNSIVDQVAAVDLPDGGDREEMLRTLLGW